MLQQLQLEYGESFDYKQSYKFAINEAHKKYNLRSKNNTEAPTKKTVQTQTKKTIEAPVSKVLQILPRETHKTSNPNISSNPKIVDITSADTQTSTAIQTIPDNKIENKTVEKQIEIPNMDKNRTKIHKIHLVKKKSFS